MLTIHNLKEILSPIVSVYEDHITNSEPVSLPYIVLIEMDSENMFADNQTWQEIIPIQAILHQASRDNTLEASIKEALTTNHIPYQVSTEWDKDNLLYATTFDLNG